ASHVRPGSSAVRAAEERVVPQSIHRCKVDSRRWDTRPPGEGEQRAVLRVGWRDGELLHVPVRDAVDLQALRGDGPGVAPVRRGEDPEAALVVGGRLVARRVEHPDGKATADDRQEEGAIVAERG